MRKVLRDEDYVPEMPIVSAPHLLAYLFEVGPVLSGSAGDAPLNNQELLAWQRNTGVELASWEARFLLRLSRSYLHQFSISGKPECKPPWIPAGLEYRKGVALNLRDSLRKLGSL